MGKLDLDVGIRTAIDLGAEYCDIRAVDVFSNSIVVKDGVADRVYSGADREYSVRVLHRGGLGFVTSNDFRKMRQNVEKALKLAKCYKKNLNVKFAPNSVVRDSFYRKPKKNPMDVSVEEKVKTLLAIEKKARGKKSVASTSVNYLDVFGKSFYASTEGSEIVGKGGRTLLYGLVFSKNKTLQSGYEVAGGQAGFEVVEQNLNIAEKAAEKATRLSKARGVKSGQRTVVTDQRMSGVLAHEAVGHACEADYLLRDASVFKDLRGHEMASELVTIVDDPTVPGLFGSYKYDSEGTAAKRNVLVENGVLLRFLHSRHTAYIMDTKPTGNSRAAVSERPIVRMSNTFFETGDSGFEELCDVEDGLYACGLRGGSVDTALGNFQFACEEGWVIKNGELAENVRDINIVGNLLTTLKEVDAVGDERFFSPGTCVKDGKQVPVSDGGPCLRIRNVLVTGSG